MYVSEHAKERYVQRIMNIKENKKMKQYIAKNNDHIERSLLKMFEYATFIWKGRLGSTINRSFWIRDDMVLVTDTYERCIVTVYNLDYGYEKEANRKLAREYLDKVFEYRELLGEDPDNEDHQKQLHYYSTRLITCLEYQQENIDFLEKIKVSS